MIARSRRIWLSNGLEFETPLLVPALSSRAVAPIELQRVPGRRPRSTVCSIVHSLYLLEGIEESLLVSAYDINHRFLDESRSFSRGFARSRYAKVRLLIIDSGWYEKSGGPPGGVFAEGIEKPLPWDEEDYERMVDDLDQQVHAVLVSWDCTGTYGEQIARAQDFLGARSRFASAALLKPPGKSRFHQWTKLSGDDVANLRAFDIVGVTEKELGDTILDRLVVLAGLRNLLDGADVSAPIQVFGGLDPLFTPLYFTAGGEIFDGLGWLRYAYRDGLAMNREAGAILDRQVSKRWQHALSTVSVQNLDVMRLLTAELRVFAHHGGDWSKISPRGEDLKPIYEQLEERLREKIGGRHGR